MVDAISSVIDADSVLSSLPALSAKANPHANIDQAAKEFEAMFATQLLKPMFDTVKVNSSFGGGNGEEVMRSFLMQEYGKIIAESGRLGIASQVKTEMIRAQEAAQARGLRGGAAAAQSAYASSAQQGVLSNVAH